MAALLAATAIQREDSSGNGAESEPDRKPASHVRRVMNANMDATHSDKSPEAEDCNLRRGRRFLGQQNPGNHRGAGVSAWEARRKRNAKAVGSGFLNDRTLTLELRLDDAIDDDGLCGQDRSEAPGGASIFFGLEATEKREKYPDESEVAEFGQRINDSVGGFGAAETIEELVDLVVKAIDSAQLMRRFVVVVREGEVRVIGCELFDGSVDEVLWWQRFSLVGARHG